MEFILRIINLFSSKYKIVSREYEQNFVKEHRALYEAYCELKELEYKSYNKVKDDINNVYMLGSHTIISRSTFEYLSNNSMKLSGEKSDLIIKNSELSAEIRVLNITIEKLAEKLKEAI